MENKNKKQSSSVVGEIQVSDEIMSFSKRTKENQTKIQRSSKKLITPAGRAMLKVMGLSINDVNGTGPDGRVLIKDILNYKDAPIKQDFSKSVEKPVIKAPEIGKQLISGLAKIKAEKLQVNLSEVVGTGQNGKILNRDIDVYIARREAERETERKAQLSKPTATNVAPSVVQQMIPGEDKIVPITKIRQTIAKTMKNSWSNVAYTNLVNEINVTKLWDMVKRVKVDILEMTGVKITFLSIILKAIALALKEFPKLNSVYNEKDQTVIYKGDYNLGVAVDTEKGLMVPVIKNVDQKKILDIAKDIIRIANAARVGKITMSDLTGGTFTVTNYGSVGALYGVPVIKYPELALAGVGAIVDKVYVGENGSFYAGKTMHLTVACDHRWIDGAEIGRFAKKVKELLENPEILGLL